MRQLPLKTDFSDRVLKPLLILAVCLLTSACSTTSLKSFDTESLAASSKQSVYLAAECDEVDFGAEKLKLAKTHIEQAITQYGFSVVHANDADFMLHVVCRKESDLNFGIIPNDISGMIMVTSIAMVPTYWPTNLWVDMDVYDLRGTKAEKLESLNASYVSQERVVWAPFLLFKWGNDFGLPKYNYEKLYKGLEFSMLNLLSTADNKSIFK